ncbi:MAG: hypothetical protein M3N54_11395, partial [Acidobacteriota bacterium]|nr:hypothetical protein [Acidobacteriota bacterium]
MLSLGMLRGAVLFAITALGVCVAQGPAVNQEGVVNSASLVPGQPVAPGSVVAIFGSQLGAQLAQADSVPWSTSLGNVSVTFNGVAAPLQFVAQGQINAQLPWDVLPTGAGTANVVVTNNGVVSAPQAVVVNPIAPGIFQASGHAIAINITDPTSARYLSFAAPAGSIPGAATFPARAGDFLFIYATGLGPVDSPVLSGHDSLDKTRQAVTKPVALVANTPANVLFAGLSPQYPGIYQVNIAVPQVSAGDALP